MAVVSGAFVLGIMLLQVTSPGYAQDADSIPTDGTSDVSSPHSNSLLPDGSVRLKGGFQPYQGRVEIYYGGSWGTICAETWSQNAAIVVCRQLGYSGVRSARETFGEGTGPILLDGLNCGGYEDGLGKCPKTSWEGPTFCNHTQDIGVLCSIGEDQATPAPSEIKDGSIRLAGGTLSHNGRVEIYYQGEWGTICRDQNDTKVPDVVCRQLGYERADPPNAVPTGGFGPGSGVIQLGHVMCEGIESKLAFCAHDTWGENDCTHADDFMVSCKTYTPPEDGALRLVAGTNAASGQVEVSYQGVWGTVCDKDWTIEDATVVCRQLGFRPARASLSYSYFLDEDSINPIFFDNVECEGSENRLEDCVHSWRGGACKHIEDVGVICGAPLVHKPVTTEDGRVRLRDGRYPHRGRVEIKYQGEWGTVCDRDWNLEAASVVCRQLGYPSAESALPGAFYREGTGVIHLDQVTCEGRESELAFCNHARWGVNECQHSQDASAVCTAPKPAREMQDGAVRFSDSEDPLRGRLQVHYQGVWGVVCGDNWDTINSDVACRQLGYWAADPSVALTLDPAGGFRPIMLDDVVCSGKEDRLVDCSHNGWAIADCESGVVRLVCLSTKPTTPTPETTTPPSTTTVRLLTTDSTNPITVESTTVTSVPEPPTPVGNASDVMRGDNDGAAGQIGESSATLGPDGKHVGSKAVFPAVWVIVVLVLMVPAIVIIFVIGLYIKHRHGTTSYKPVHQGAIPMQAHV
ncbi:deleted in malignant brain tumors 1 protein-like isoform X2 [Acanthaster planci]|uniref:Deleted in malignant brain tumors 1 protein-like isoform X2 n=1 Tax=Acanthaster planci TaxID=133434 RepID=A0A8B7YV17_ACAPL|nr:deleted in malignant brain tumors 1 protein-like isoform X2 [Acanthaster planci]